MSRYDHPDAGTGTDSTQWDEKPIDSADELIDVLRGYVQDDPDLDPRDPRRLGSVSRAFEASQS